MKHQPKRQKESLKKPQQGLRKIFSEVPQTYVLINHVLTLGLDVVWRKRAGRIADGTGGSMWLDVCTGTGDMAQTLSRQAGNGVSIYIVDFSEHMLQQCYASNQYSRFIPCLANVRHLPYPSNTFDLVTISFATRNLNITRDNLTACFSEFHRVLKPGGVFINLETSQPQNKLIRRIVHFYIALAVRPIGRLISGSDRAYCYLSETIPRFYEAQELSDILYESGFSKVEHEPLFFGVSAIHSAMK